MRVLALHHGVAGEAVVAGVVRLARASTEREMRTALRPLYEGRDLDEHFEGRPITQAARRARSWLASLRALEGNEPQNVPPRQRDYSHIADYRAAVVAWKEASRENVGSAALDRELGKWLKKFSRAARSELWLNTRNGKAPELDGWHAPVDPSAWVAVGVALLRAKNMREYRQLVAVCAKCGSWFYIPREGRGRRPTKWCSDRCGNAARQKAFRSRRALGE
jgi:hypothetical protein